MNFNTLKFSAAVAAVAMGIAFLPQSANAQTETVNATLITSSAITVTDGVDMDFGTWFILHRNADNFTIVTSTANATTVSGLGGTPADSQAIETVAADDSGTVLVTLPVGVNGIVLNMQRGAITNFTDAALSLGSITYGTVTEGNNVALAQATNVPVTVVTGGTDEIVSYGATITVSGNPADATHTASFDVTFAY